MKQVLILLIFLSQSLSLSAQDEDIYSLEGVKWYVGGTCYDGGNNPTSNDDEYFAGNDTVISGKLYKPIFKDFISNIAFFMRTDGSKVYYKTWQSANLNDTTEHLVFNYDLIVGDTFNYPEYYDYYSYNMAHIVAIDSVPLLDGSYRRRYELNVPFSNICGETTHWIEGIGSVPTPFYFRNCFECQFNGFRYYKNDELLFEIWNDTSSAKDITNPEAEIRILGNSIQIITEKTIRSASTFGVNGQKYGDFNNSDQIDISNLPRGIYILTVIFEDNNHRAFKFFK